MIRLFKTFIDDNGLSGHHVRSYDSMFGNRLLPILHKFAGAPRSLTREGGHAMCPTTLQLELPWLERVSDDLARLRASVVIEVPGEVTFKVPNVHLCSIPIMAGSRLAARLGCDPKCPVGSFMVSNAEGTTSTPKAILMQERSASNFLKFKIAQKAATVSLTSVDGDRRLPIAVSMGVHTDSIHILKHSKNVVRLDELATGTARQFGLTIDVCVNGLPKAINLAAFVAACRWEESPDDDGIDVFCRLLTQNKDKEFENHDLNPTLIAARAFLQKDAFTCKEAWNHLESIFDDSLVRTPTENLKSAILDAFPHIRSNPSLGKVALYSAYLSERLMDELVAPKDRSAFLVGKDRTECKRYDSAGELLSELLNLSLLAASNVLSEKVKCVKRNTAVVDVVKKVTEAFSDANDIFWTALRTGKWFSGVPRKAPRGQGGGSKWLDPASTSASSWQKLGVCQPIPMDNRVGCASILRRIVSPLANAETLSKVDEPRMIDPMSKGKICCAETPDGADVGLKKNLALTGTLSVHVSGAHEAFSDLLSGPRTDEKNTEPGKLCRVFVDGDMIATSPLRPSEVAARFREFRASGDISARFWRAAPSVQVIESLSEVLVWTDAGRLVMPVKESKRESYRTVVGDWLNMVREGKALLLDAAEEACVSLDWDQDHSQSQDHYDYEVIYSHGILGVPAALIPFSKHNQAPRLQFGASMMKQAIEPVLPSADGEKSKYRLDFCQAPLVRAKTARYLPYGLDHTGQNVQVAVMIDSSGYAQEDALIYNRGSLERGRFSMTMHQMFEDVVDSRGGSSRALCGRAPLQKVGQIKEGDVIIPDPSAVAPLRGRIVSVTKLDPSSHSSDSMVDPHQIQRAHVITACTPLVGDKFTSRHGQKGVIARVEPEENLPFAEDGSIPELIINPHAFPSRMTEGQHIEGVVGLAAASNGTIFEEGSIESDPDSVVEYLRAAGFMDGGKKVLRCGRTGRAFRTKVLIAPVYYNRLVHLVENKARVRGRGGSIDPLTQQPAKGRKNGGGIRLGEMEAHAILAQGANDVLKDRLTDTASFLATIDEESGTFLYDTIPAREFTKDNVDAGPSVREVRMPHATKLMFQEMEALGVTFSLGDPLAMPPFETL